MLNSILLLSSMLAVTPTITSRDIWSCPQVGTWGVDTEYNDVLNSYDGSVMSLEFDTTTSGIYNPLYTNPMDVATNYHFYIDINLEQYVDTHGSIFPYYIMSFDGGDSWQQIPITEDIHSLDLYCKYGELENILIMYDITGVNHIETNYYFENWQVTFYLESAFADISSQEYQSGYNTGYSDGYNNGNSRGYNLGYNTGYNVGYNDGTNTDITTNGFKTMLNTIVSYPVNFLKTAFNFELFGINISALIMFILSCGIVIWVINKFRK